VTDFARHLSQSEIDWLIEAQPGTDETPAEMRNARNHFTQCAECQKRVRMQEEVGDRLRGLKNTDRVSRTAACPSGGFIRDFAAGIGNPESFESVIEHITQCDYCSMVLRDAAEAFSEDSTDAELQAVASLASTQPGWQRELAQRLAFGPPPERVTTAVASVHPQRFWSLPRLAISFAGATVLLVAVLGYWIYPRSGRVDRLLAEAYTEHRTLDMRVPNARYAPIRVERGRVQSLPSELHEAMAIVMRELATHPEDAKLLAEKGRAQILAGDYQGAIQNLEHARRLEPASDAILTDLATAYFQVAETGGLEINRATALDLLGQVLAKDPNNAVALYNRAIANEHLPANEQQAIDDWQRYLAIDPHGDWAAEARRRLEELQRRNRNEPVSQVLEPPSSLPGEVREGSASRFEPRDEEALDLALREGLPKSLDEPTPTPGMVGPETTAVRSLAQKLWRDHGDRWLLDIARSRRSAEFSAGIRDLSLAVKSDAVGDASGAIARAALAEASFRNAGNNAGYVRARLERVYALQRALRVNECMTVARGLEKPLEGHGYAWAEIQLLLEESACENMTGNVGYEEPRLERAVNLARLHSYGILYLRGLGFAGSLETAKGNWSRAWDDDLEGLRVYAAGRYPVLRAYQFFSDMALSAEAAHRWHLALGLWREAITLAAGSGNIALEAQSTYQLASLESLLGEGGRAMRDFSRSSELYSRLPRSDAVRAYLLNGEISVAALEARSGNFASALERLEKVRPDLPLVSDYEIPLRFYQTLGQLYMRRKDVDRAGSALTTAISIAEWGLSSLPASSDRFAWERNTREAYRSLVELQLRLQNDPESALATWEWYRGASLRPRRLSDSRLNVDDLRTNPLDAKVGETRRLIKSRRETVLLVYARLSSGYAGWIVREGDVRGIFMPADPSFLDDLGETFTEECADASSNRSLLDRHGNQLYRAFIEPFSDRLGPEGELAIETDGVLDKIPLGALIDDSGRPFGNRYAVLEFPGVLQGRTLRSPARLLGSERALVIGAPALSPKLAESYPTLSDAQDEAAAIAHRFKNSVLLTGTDASLHRVEEGLRDADVFHFAGHSFSTSARGGLLLATPKDGTADGGESSVLYASSLDPLVVHRCRLVVLSACATTSSGITEIADPGGLVQAFQRAGVSNVVASRWNVDSASTAAYMKEFYARLLSEDSAAIASQHAAIAVQSNQRTSHPYYWAAFATFGIPNR
jgi:CHAT domain-containing protein/cytochrome c-type biogenesis protein CcmH/NrfG